MKKARNIAGKGANKAIAGAFIAALVLIAAGYHFRNDLFPDPQKNPDARFKGCSLLAENCVDIAVCPMNAYCGDGIFQDCRIYDCKSTYGIATADMDGRISFREEAKPDEDAVQAVRNSCSGTMETLSRKCAENKTEIEVKLDTAGECPIESFAVIFKDTGVAPSEFISEGGGIYAITAQTCGTIDRIIPAAAGGIGLEFEGA